MSGPDFETLLRSPLDDEPDSRGWGSAVLGLLAGSAAIIGLSFVLGLWATPGETPATMVTDTVASATDPPGEFSNSFPDGFSEVGGSVAMKPTATVDGGTGFIVSFATATHRDTDPETTPVPLGGQWQFESAGGSVTGATRLVYDRLHTGVIGVEFAGHPSDGDILRMTERWDPVERTESADVSFTGTPFTTTDAVDIDLGDGITLRMTQIELGRHLGRIVWTLSGSGEPTGVVAFAVAMINQQGATVGDYVSMPSLRDPTRSSGVVDLFWDRGFNAHPDEGSIVEITATVQLVVPEPIDVVFDLDTVPSG
ncbi:MAG: hypothetical protein M3096_09330 [Actinomycetia bacterium]|nr:hypothetical protein [Actinomycetes bacterium]